MMIEHIPEMVQAGIDSFKIEGRMKSAYYVGCVVNAYRRAIDAYLAAPEGYMVDPSLVEELRESATRQFTTGFFFGNPHEEGQDIQKSLMDRQTEMCIRDSFTAKSMLEMASISPLGDWYFSETF